jgi:major membrane immunogen (membrane-anchored lipoprotein)
MHRALRALFGTVVVVGLVVTIGCGDKSKTDKRSDTRTPGQYFKDEQSATVTPNGKILADSVEEKEGRIEYKTEDGKAWRVGYSKRADGTYQYGTPDEVK